MPSEPTLWLYSLRKTALNMLFDFLFFVSGYLRCMLVQIVAWISNEWIKPSIIVIFVIENDVVHLRGSSVVVISVFEKNKVRHFLL